MAPSPSSSRPQREAKSCLEAVQSILFLLLRLIKLRHPLLKGLASAFGAHTHLTLLLDRLRARAGIPVVSTKADELIFKPRALLAPTFHFGFGAVGGGFEVDEGFFERGGELLFGEEVLFDGADAAVLLFDDLGEVWAEFFGGVAGAGR